MQWNLCNLRRENDQVYLGKLKMESQKRGHVGWISKSEWELQENRCGERALLMSGKPTTVPLPPSLETASLLRCFVKKLEPELKSSWVQANGLFITITGAIALGCSLC